MNAYRTPQPNHSKRGLPGCIFLLYTYKCCDYSVFDAVTASDTLGLEYLTSAMNADVNILDYQRGRAVYCAMYMTYESPLTRPAILRLLIRGGARVTLHQHLSFTYNWPEEFNLIYTAALSQRGVHLSPHILAPIVVCAEDISWVMSSGYFSKQIVLETIARVHPGYPRYDYASKFLYSFSAKNRHKFSVTND